MRGTRTHWRDGGCKLNFLFFLYFFKYMYESMAGVGWWCGGVVFCTEFFRLCSLVSNVESRMSNVFVCAAQYYVLQVYGYPYVCMCNMYVQVLLYVTTTR